MPHPASRLRLNRLKIAPLIAPLNWPGMGCHRERRASHLPSRPQSYALLASAFVITPSARHFLV